MSKPMNVRTKKLLVAAVGVASVSYLACSTTSGSPAAAGDASPDAPNETGDDVFISSGNLVGPLPDASADAPAPADAQGDALQDLFIGSGNLVAPLPDAGRD